MGKLSGPAEWQSAPGNSDAQEVLGAVVEDEHQSATNAAHHIREETLVQTFSQALLGRDLLEAIAGALVEVLLRRLLRLHLQAAAHGVEGVGGAGSDGDRGLRGGEGAGSAEDPLVRLVGIQPRDG